MKFECPQCGQHLTASTEEIGVVAPCPSCGKPVRVPNYVSFAAVPTSGSTTRKTTLFYAVLTAIISLILGVTLSSHFRSPDEKRVAKTEAPATDQPPDAVL